MATVTVELTTWERTRLVQVVGQLRGGAALVRTAMHILDKLELTDKEKEQVGWQDVGAAAKWEKAELTFEVAFTIEEWRLLEQAVNDFKWEPSPIVVALLDKIVPEEGT